MSEQVTIADQLAPIINALLDSGVPLRLARDAFEDKLISAALEKNDGNITLTARALGIHRNSLHNKMQPSERAIRLRALKARRRR